MQERISWQSWDDIESIFLRHYSSNRMKLIVTSDFKLIKMIWWELQWIIEGNHYLNLDSETGKILRKKIEIIEFKSCLAYFWFYFRCVIGKQIFWTTQPFQTKWTEKSMNFTWRRESLDFAESPLGFDQDGL